MAKLLLITLGVLSSEVHAATPELETARELSDEAPSNLWRWLLNDAVDQSIVLSSELQCLALNIY
ncbi:MAG: hypothetical protein P8163_17175, partial [Candidatus Thiodiazotropha sp.]